MSHHSTAFEVERPVPAGDAVKDHKEARSTHFMVRYPLEDAVLVPYALLILVLLWRPTGLAGKRLA